MRKIIKWVLLILWVSLIFYMSNQIGKDSSNASGFFVKELVKIVPILKPYTSIISFFVRKVAHIVEYFILGILVYQLVDEYFIKDKRLVSILICIFLSCFDEIHQLFVPLRNGTIIDIFYDSLGFLLAIYLLDVIKRKTKHYNVLCGKKEG